MILDIDRSFGEIQPDDVQFRQQLQELSKLTKNVGVIREWARKLKFITSHPDCRTTDIIERAEKTLPPSHTFTFKDGFSQSQANPSRICRCNSWSQRGVNFTDKRLWITGKDDAPDCTHFVAVSYCWPQPTENGLVELPLYTMSSDMASKFNDAPNDIIERALKFAHYQGLSAVWIDQECIDQSDPDDKEQGINSMDLVYENAEWSAAVLSLYIEEQTFMNFLDYERLCTYDIDTRETLDEFIRFMRWLDAERWFTRAWCLQEVWSAGTNMVLMIRYNTSLDKPSGLGDMDGEVLVRAAAIPLILEIMVACLKRQEVLFDDTLLDEVWLDTLRRRHTKILSSSESPEIRVGSGKPRINCSAAEALHFLALRGNTVISDRLAILGNLCNYPLRLDTRAVEENGYSFSICAFALAVMNGDLSLMNCLPLQAAPNLQLHNSNVQHDEGASEVATIGSAEKLGYSWGPPSNGTLTNLQFVSEVAVTRRLTNSMVGEDGLSTMGWIFVCDLIIDTSPVQRLFQTEWESQLGRRDQSSAIDASSVKLKIRIIWSLIRLLLRKHYYDLAQIVWNFENDLQIEIKTNDPDENPNASEGKSQSIETPQNLRDLIAADGEEFIYNHPPLVIQSEEDFLSKIAPKDRAADTADSRRSWLAETVMTGRLVCGRQVNSGLNLQHQPTMVRTSPEQGLIVRDGTTENPFSAPPNQSSQVPRAEELVPGTPNLKSKYTSVFESEFAFNKSVFVVSVQSTVHPHSTLHTWRPLHWVGKRLFKGSLGDNWRIEGGEMIRGYVQPTSMFSPCLLV